MTSRLPLFLLVVAAAPAWATATFPTAIKTKLGLAAEPPQSCGVCHRNNQLGSGTVTTPFGASMRAAGLLPNNETSLNSALDTLETNMTDSDMDGVPDVTELRNVTDPNRADAVTDGGLGGGAGGGSGGGAGGGTGGGTVEELPPPRYGCGANAAPGLVGLLGLLSGLTLRRRR